MHAHSSSSRCLVRSISDGGTPQDSPSCRAAVLCGVIARNDSPHPNDRSEKDTANSTLEKRLWDAADQFGANSGLKAQNYSGPILGLIFLRFAEVCFAAQRTKLDIGAASSRRGSRVDDPNAHHARLRNSRLGGLRRLRTDL